MSSMVGFGVLLLAAGGAFIAAGALNYRGTWRPLNIFLPHLGSGIFFMGCGIVLWGVIAVATGGLTQGGTQDLAPEYQWIFTFAGLAALLLFGAGAFFGYSHLPRRLRPRWMTDADGTTDPVAADGSPASLPRWSAATTRATIATSRGPLLTPEAVDWLYRSWAGRGWARFGESAAAAPLRSLGMVNADGRAAPEVLLASQPLMSDATTAYIVALQPDPEAAETRATELVLRLGRRNAVVLWQEETWPVQQHGLDDERGIRQRLGMLTGHGRRRKVNAPYRVDFVAPEAAGAWVLDFVEATAGEHTSWRIHLDHEALPLLPGPVSGEYLTESGQTVTTAHLLRRLDSSLRGTPA